MIVYFDAHKTEKRSFSNSQKTTVKKSVKPVTSLNKRKRIPPNEERVIKQAIERAAAISW